MARLLRLQYTKSWSYLDKTCSNSCYEATTRIVRTVQMVGQIRVSDCSKLFLCSHDWDLSHVVLIFDRGEMRATFPQIVSKWLFVLVTWINHRASHGHLSRIEATCAKNWRSRQVPSWSWVLRTVALLEEDVGHERNWNLCPLKYQQFIVTEPKTWLF